MPLPGRSSLNAQARLLLQDAFSLKQLHHPGPFPFLPPLQEIGHGHGAVLVPQIPLIIVFSGDIYSVLTEQILRIRHQGHHQLVPVGILSHKIGGCHSLADPAVLIYGAGPDHSRRFGVALSLFFHPVHLHILDKCLIRLRFFPGCHPDGLRVKNPILVRETSVQGVVDPGPLRSPDLQPERFVIESAFH